MRSTLATLTAALLLATATAFAQDPPPETPTAGQFDFGARITSVDGDGARYQRYRDFRDGAYLDAFRFERERDTWLVNVKANHIGYRDQRYEVEASRFGKVKFSFLFDQTPLYYSADTATAFTQEGDGATFRISDDFQRAVQSRQLTRYAFNNLASPFELRQRRDVMVAGVTYTVRPDLDLIVRLSNTTKTGAQNWMSPFGFSNTIELPIPLDTRTTDLTTAAEWANRRGLVRVAYDGSWFDNANPTLVWDNPIRITDIDNPSGYSSGDASSQGRMALWPNSTSHTLSALGSVALPGRSRVYGYLSGGTWNQDEPLLPHTINTAVRVIPLERQTAEAEARITSSTLGFVTRPSSLVWFATRYRYYEYDNRMPHIGIKDYVRFDATASQYAVDGPEPFSYTRHFFDADVSLTPTRYVALRGGFGRETDDRTFRVFEQTNENTFRASIDSTGLPYVTVRGVYEYSKRTGDGLDEQVLDDIGEQASLRQFDISDRTRKRYSTVVQLVPVDAVGLSFTAGFGDDDRPDAAFGLQDNDHYFWTMGLDVVPEDRVAFGVEYGREHYTSLQRSRQANPGPQFNDPTRDWTTDAEETINSFYASAELRRLFPRTNVQFGFEWSDSDARYLYGLVPGSTLSTPVQLPEINNGLTTVSADVQYFITRRVALRLAYMFEEYTTDDYAFEPTVFVADSLVQPVPPGSPTTTYLRYMYRPYTANTAWVGLRYFW